MSRNRKSTIAAEVIETGMEIATDETTQVVETTTETGTDIAEVVTVAAATETGTDLEVVMPTTPIADELNALAADDLDAEDAAKNVPVGIRYRLVNDDFKAPRGLDSAMYAQFKLTPSATVVELVAALLASGAYMKVAPAAAIARPRKPVSFTCRKWVAQGVLVVD
jgi:hypothetical protein